MQGEFGKRYVDFPTSWAQRVVKSPLCPRVGGPETARVFNWLMRLRKYNQWKINKTVLDSEFQVVDSGNQVLDSWFFVSGTWIPDSNRQWDPNSLSCIPDVDTWMKWITSVQEIFLLMYRPIEILVTRPPGHARDLTTTTWPRRGCGMCVCFPGPWPGVCHQTEKRRKTEAKA